MTGRAMKYPEVRLEVTTEDRIVDMIEEGYDLIIRVNPAPDESFIGRVFLRDRLVVVASPAFVRLKGNVAVPSVIRGAGDQGPVWPITTPGGRFQIHVATVLSLSSMFMVRDAVRAGVGVSRLPISLVARDLLNGQMVHWGDVDGPEVARWTLYPSRRLLSARVSAFLEYLKDAFPTGRPGELTSFITS
jgi:DNA-binding transcriptional LysR family regulator